jgi:hypothetical protein
MLLGLLREGDMLPFAFREFAPARDGSATLARGSLVLRQVMSR